MAFFNIFKNRKEIKKPKTERPKARKQKVVKEKAEKPEVKEAAVVKEPVKTAKKASKPKKVSEAAAKMLKEPQVTEKATDLVDKNQYVFKVWPRSNKNEIKRAVEELYGVDVLGVKIINVPKKQRRLGRTKGYKSGYKKAVVKIQNGQKIEILPR